MFGHQTIEETELTKADRTQHSLKKSGRVSAFHCADQILPGSGTFDLFVGPF